MGVAEVERFEGVGRGVMGLIRLRKCVEKSKSLGPKSATIDSLNKGFAVVAQILNGRSILSENA